MDAELKRMRNTAIAVFAVLLLAVVLIVRNHLDEEETAYLLREKAGISKMEIRFTSPSGDKFVISDRILLDSINRALMGIKEIDAQVGGIHDISVEINVFKKSKTINFWVQHSPYNGWMLIIGNRTFQSDYMFRLIKLYSN